MATSGVLSAERSTLRPEARRRDSIYENSVKPLFDRAVAVVLLAALAPAFLLVCALVRTSAGPGPVLYSQRRVGRDGEPFRIFKFRTMRNDRRSEGRERYAGPDRRFTHKSDNDPRHTGFGRWMRATSIDELPQLINIVRGEMSLVGPRPELLAIAARGGYLDHPRHLVRPGMTGPYQVSSMRSSNRLADGLELDRRYVADVSLRNDLKYLLLTPWAVLTRRGS